MKYVYIVGLEHSGSTLANHLLCQPSNSLGLGEVASFFNSTHMKNYISRWGEYPDARLCSCGEEWEDCEFWGKIALLNGLNAESSVLSKYKELFKYLKSRHSSCELIVDSSKNLETIKLLISHAEDFGLETEDIAIVVVVKDVRSFAASIHAKSGNKNSLISILKTFNWWQGAGLFNARRARHRFEDYLNKAHCRRALH